MASTRGTNYKNRMIRQINQKRQDKIDRAEIKLMQDVILMRNYENAYLELTGLETTITQNKGWFYVLGHGVRREGLIESTQRLLVSIQLRDSETAAREDRCPIYASSLPAPYRGKMK